MSDSSDSFGGVSTNLYGYAVTVHGPAFGPLEVLLLLVLTLLVVGGIALYVLVHVLPIITVVRQHLAHHPRRIHP